MSHHNYISLPHSDQLLPFLASTQGCSHTVNRSRIHGWGSMQRGPHRL